MNADLHDGSRRVVGTRQLLKKLAVNGIEAMYIAEDAQEHIKEKLLSLAQANGVEIILVATMNELGRMCGIAVGSAAAGLLKEVH